MKANFPMSVKRGSVTVRIYRQTTKQGYGSFTVAHYEADGIRRRASFSGFDEARGHAEATAERLSQGLGVPLVLAGQERLVYTRATEALEPLQIPLDVAAEEYAQASRLMGGRGGILEAVRYFAKHQGGHVASRRVQEVVEELIVTRQKDGSSVRHVQDLRSRLNRFAASFSCEIAGVTAADIQEFLLSLKLAPKSVNNFRTAISNLISFARLKRYVSKDSKPMEEVPEVKEPERDIGIYTPGELRLLIQHAPERFKPYVVLAGLAGLRQSEIGRLEWRHIGEDYIRVPGGEKRTKSKRLVRIEPILKLWLALFRQPEGRVVPFVNLSNEIVDLCKKAGVRPAHNGLRHSYGSYRVAVLQDPAKVAHEMGNSARIVAKHYQELVTVEEAAAWFQTAPDPPANVVPAQPEGVAAGSESAELKTT